MLGGALNDYKCGGAAAMFNWIRTKAVKAALSVRHDANFFSGDNGVGFTYTLTEDNLMPFYQELMNDTNNETLRIMII
jgi:hypothetical protein